MPGLIKWFRELVQEKPKQYDWESLEDPTLENSDPDGILTSLDDL